MLFRFSFLILPSFSFLSFLFLIFHKLWLFPVHSVPSSISHTYIYYFFLSYVSICFISISSFFRLFPFIRFLLTCLNLLNLFVLPVSHSPFSSLFILFLHLFLIIFIIYMFFCLFSIIFTFFCYLFIFHFCSFYRLPFLFSFSQFAYTLNSFYVSHIPLLTSSLFQSFTSLHFFASLSFVPPPCLTSRLTCVKTVRRNKK